METRRAVCGYDCMALGFGMQKQMCVVRDAGKWNLTCAAALEARPNHQSHSLTRPYPQALPAGGRVLIPANLRTAAAEKLVDCGGGARAHVDIKEVGVHPREAAGTGSGDLGARTGGGLNLVGCVLDLRIAVAGLACLRNVVGCVRDPGLLEGDPLRGRATRIFGGGPRCCCCCCCCCCRCCY